jgi:hypothetical protein
MTGNCTTGFSLLETHVCSLNPSLKPTVNLSANSASVPALMAAQSASAQERSGSQKRKASTPVAEERHLDKRQRTAELDNIDVEEKNPDGPSTSLHCICVGPPLRFLHSCAYTPVLASAARRASVRGGNSENADTSKKGAKRVKSPKSKSPAPPMSESAPTSAVGNEDINDTVLQLMGHEAEVCNYGALNIATNQELVRFSFALGTPFTTTY